MISPKYFVGNLPSSNQGSGSGGTTTVISGVGALGNAAALANPLTLNALNLSSLGMNQLASVLNPQALGDLGSGLQNAQAANVFNLPGGVGQVNPLNNPSNQFGGGAGTLSMNALGVGNQGGVGGLGSAGVGSLMGNPGSGTGGSGGAQGNPQPSPFQKYENAMFETSSQLGLKKLAEQSKSENMYRDRASLDNFDKLLSSASNILKDAGYVSCFADPRTK